MHPQYRGVAFLLSLGSLPIACGKDEPADDTTTGGPTNAESTVGAEVTGNNPTTSGTSTTAGPLTTTGDGTTAPPDPSTEPPETTFLTNNSTSSASAEETGGIPDFPPPMNPVCQGYADHLIECFPRYSDYGNALGYYCDEYIQYGMRTDGPACAAAIEAMFACFNAIPCEDIEMEGNCEAEFMAVDAACPSFEDIPDTDTFGESGSGSGSTG